MNDIFDTFAALAAQQQAKSREEFVRYESRVIVQQVNADALIADGAIDRMRAAIERLERELEALEHYERHIYGRAPQ